MITKKYKRILFSVCILLIILFTGVGIISEIDKFSIEKEKIPFTLLSGNDTTLTIGIIGDSWIAGNKLDTILKEELYKKRRSCKIVSSGQWGATTKNVYQNLFKDTVEEYSSKKVLLAKPDYCCISSGINDIGSKMGPFFYSGHLLLIIKLLRNYKIKPVIIIFPGMEINANFKEGVFKKIKSAVRNIFSQSEGINNADDYKAAFMNELNKSGYKDSVLIIDMAFAENEKEYVNFSNLSIKPYHLTAGGNRRLANKIAAVIITDHQSNQ